MQTINKHSQYLFKNQVLLKIINGLIYLKKEGGFMENLIGFSDNAAQKLKKLIEEQNNDKLGLRIYITGGGCSGFQYGFTFDEKISEDDILIKKENVFLVIDPMSLQYLVGSQVDYVEGLEGSRFVIKNPNAKTTCGCGSSFSV